MMWFDSCIDYQRARASPMFLLREAPNAMNVRGRVRAREGYPQPVVHRPSCEIGVIRQQQIEKRLAPGVRNSLTRTIAWGWVRTGNMTRARATLSATGAEGDSSDAAGWLALYEGNLKTARTLLLQQP